MMNVKTAYRLDISGKIEGEKEIKKQNQCFKITADFKTFLAFTNARMSVIRVNK